MPRGAKELIKDRVHPGPAGQLLMAEALLKAWNAPAVVSSVELDAASGKVIKPDELQGRRPQSRRHDRVDTARFRPADADRQEGQGHRAGREGV